MKFLAVVFLCLAPVVAQAAFEEKPIATLRWLNKITAQTESMDVPIGETVHYGDLAVRVRSCRKQDPLEGADSTAFLQVWEKDEDGAPRWVFSGWMFASSPGLSAMDHPIYDVWPLDCTDSLEKSAEQKKEEKAKEADDEDDKADSESGVNAEGETETP